MTSVAPGFESRGGKRFFSPTERADRLLGPPSVLFSHTASKVGGGAWNWPHTPQSGTEVKNAWSHSSTPPVCMAFTGGTLPLLYCSGVDETVTRQCHLRPNGGSTSVIVIFDDLYVWNLITVHHRQWMQQGTVSWILQWCWVWFQTCSQEGGGAFMSVVYTEASIVWRIKGPYVAPRLALKGFKSMSGRHFEGCVSADACGGWGTVCYRWTVRHGACTC